MAWAMALPIWPRRCSGKRGIHPWIFVLQNTLYGRIHQLIPILIETKFTFIRISLFPFLHFFFSIYLSSQQTKQTTVAQSWLQSTFKLFPRCSPCEKLSVSLLVMREWSIGVRVYPPMCIIRCFVATDLKIPPSNHYFCIYHEFIHL